MKRSQALLKWYEPIEYGRSRSGSPNFDRFFPFFMSLVVATLFTSEIAGKPPPFRFSHLVTFLLLFFWGGLLFSFIFPYLFREEVHLSVEGVTRTAGRMPPRFTAYWLIERCELLPAGQYTLMRLKLRDAHVPPKPIPVRETALPAHADLDHVCAIMKEAGVPVVFKRRASETALR